MKPQLTKVAEQLRLDEIVSSQSLDGFTIRMRIGEEWQTLVISMTNLEMVRDPNRYVGELVVDAANALRTRAGKPSLDVVGKSDASTIRNRFDAVVAEVRDEAIHDRRKQ